MSLGAIMDELTTRPRGAIEVNAEELASLVAARTGEYVTGAEWDAGRQMLRVYLQGGHLPRTVLGCEPPVVDVIGEV